MTGNQHAADTSFDEVHQSGLEDESQPTASRGNGNGVRRIVVMVVLILVAWRLYSDREYWHSAWKQRRIWPKYSAGQGGLLAESPVAGPSQFDLSDSIVPVDEILSGGPAKDGIPALTDPMLVEADAASYLKPADRVIGFVAGQQARAYPLKILNYHEIVNDHIGRLPVAVTYCPLCDSCAVLDRRTELGPREFGVSGLLYNSNMLLYDRGGQPESLWSQVKAEGVSGPAAGKPLTALPMELTTWEDWRFRHPETKVLAKETGYPRDYGHSPYADYFDTPRLVYPATPTSEQLPAKERVLAVWTGSVACAYPQSVFGGDRLRVVDRLDGKRIVIQFNPEAESLRVVESDEGVQWMYSFWFAWYAMRPDSRVFEP